MWALAEMRKDYTPIGSSDFLDESQFISDYWTRVWENEGGPKGKSSKVLRQEEYRLMRPHLGDLRPGARVLDGGCGLGDWVLALDRQGFKTTGMDVSFNTIVQLRHLFPTSDFVHGDIRKTPYCDGEIDAYFSWGVFEHFEAGPQDCIREAWRLLRPGAKLFITVPYDNLRQALRGCLEPPSRKGNRERFYQYRFTRAEIARELEMGGFEVLFVSPIHKRQGVLRSLHHEFGLPYYWKLTKLLSIMLAPVLPANLVGHMLFIVARKSRVPCKD